MEEADLVVIGAGWYGLAAARTYIHLHPDEKVIVVEAAGTVGGVWAEHRLYPGLKSNNMLGTYEYSDFPMNEATFGVKPGEHIPAAVLHQYLTKYAQHFGIFDHIRFNTKVKAAEPGENGGWSLTVSAEDKESTIVTKKLIVATGLTSEAYLPTITGSKSFGSPLFHSRHFLDYADTLKTAKNVTVLGGAKSAWDAAYAYASAGVSVDMIIRKSGRGPVWMAPPYVTPLKKWLEKLVHTRFLTWFSPCIWGTEDGYGRIRKFLHGSFVGRKIVDTFWKILGSDVIDLNGYDKHPEVKKLKPWNDAFWIGSGLSILNFPTNFFDLVKDGTIRVHVADITHLSEKTVHLSTGDSLAADAFLCATGWKADPPVNFRPSGSDESLGLPFYSSKSDQLALKADLEILSQFPRLKDQPEVQNSTREGNVDSPNQPFRLYRFMVPPTSNGNRDIAFAGMMTTITTAICAQTQALWISAYMDGALDRLPTSTESMRWETMLHSQFGKWRYPCGYGGKLPDFVFDAIPYIDMLLADLGLKSHRKQSGVAEVFQPYGPEDYKELIREWKSQHAISA